MDFDHIIVKESPGLCRCCLSEGCYKDLSTEYPWMEDTEVYADMLLECFDISISQHIDGPNGPNRLICEVCITRLRDACNFKKQVLESEKKFVDMIGRGEFRSEVIYEDHMKDEMGLDSMPMDSGGVEFIEDDFDNESLKDESTSTLTEVTATPLPVKAKKGRPKKRLSGEKTEKKAKVAKLEDKPRTSKAVSKGKKRQEMASMEARSKSSISNTKRNRLIKTNAITILESSTAIPFKWHRHNYLCFFCHKDFKDVKDLKEHTTEKHKNSSVKSAVCYLKRDEKVKIDVSSLICKICNTSIDDFNTLVDHFKIIHAKTFAPFGYGVIPYRLQRDTYQCAVCNKQFHYFIKLNEHMNDHFGNYVCELCGKSFLSQDRLRCHAANHGSGYKCNACPKMFDSLTQKNSHEAQIHNKDTRIKCLFCSETFKNYTLRKRHHSSVHHVQMPAINCPACGKTFEILSKMRTHLKEVHVQEKNYPCTLCELKFFSRTHVQRHMVKHSGERIHQCDVCKKSYARKQTLRDHMRIHTNDKKHVCPVCCQAFVQSNSLRMHLKVHHQDSVES